MGKLRLDCLAPPNTQKWPYIVAAPYRHLNREKHCVFLCHDDHAHTRTYTRTHAHVCVRCAVHFKHIVLLLLNDQLCKSNVDETQTHVSVFTFIC